MSCDPSASAVQTAQQLYVTAENTFNKDPNVVGYKICSAQNPTIYQPLPTLQSSPTQSQLNAQEVAQLYGNYQGNTVLYSSLLQSVKVMMAAAEPLTEYRELLNIQLSVQTQENKGFESQLTTSTNMANNLNSGNILSNTGPFGFATIRQGIGYSFMGVYNSFFLLLAIAFYIRFKNSLGMIPTILGILIVLAGAVALEMVYLVFPLVYNIYIPGAYG